MITVVFTDPSASYFALSSFTVYPAYKPQRAGTESRGLTNKIVVQSEETADHGSQSKDTHLPPPQMFLHRRKKRLKIVSYHNDQLWAGHEFHHPRENPCIQDNLDAIVGTIGQIGNSPAGVRNYFLVLMFHEADEDGQNLIHRIQRRVGVLVPTEV